MATLFGVSAPNLIMHIRCAYIPSHLPAFPLLPEVLSSPEQTHLPVFGLRGRGLVQQAGRDRPWEGLGETRLATRASCPQQPLQRPGQAARWTEVLCANLCQAVGPPRITPPLSPRGEQALCLGASPSPRAGELIPGQHGLHRQWAG